jgi:hypothetical protein
MLLAWTIPNTAASIVGGAVSLNLSHAFEAAMAGYGLGRILTSQNAGAESGSSAQGGHSLGASLEAGDNAAANNGARSTSSRATVRMPAGTKGSIASPIPSGNQTSRGGHDPTTQQANSAVQTVRQLAP